MEKEGDRPTRARGRPRSFDRDAALERAMKVFWRQGYEATSLADLTAAMGINPPSLYAAFGDKEQLFLEAVERYERGHRGSAAGGCMFGEEPTARGAIERVLRDVVDEFTKPDQPRGCMLMLAATNCSAESVQTALAERRAQSKALIRKRIAQGISAGELPHGTDAGALAEFYTTVLAGMSLQARDGASRKSLEATAAAAMRAWPEPHRPPATKRRPARAA
jgi:AcrR family transcriptional regulator